MFGESIRDVIVLAAMLTLVHCGGQAARRAPEAPAPAQRQSASPESELDASSELAALEDDLAASERKLLSQLDRRRHEPKQTRQDYPGARSKAPESGGAGAGTADEAPAPASQPAQPEPSIGAAEGRPLADGEPAEREARGSPCEVACRALSSMQRIAERICALTSETHPRCESARGRVQEAEQRMALGGCACATRVPEE